MSGTAERPRLRGRLHQGAFFVSLVTGTVLVAMAPTARARIAAVIYASSVSLLFGTSALYHVRCWGPVAALRLRRLDHCMILVLIAGTQTPFALLVLPGRSGPILLTVVWVGAALGVAVLATLASRRSDGLLAGGDTAAQALTGGYRLAFGVGAALVLAGMALAATVPRPREPIEAAVAPADAIELDEAA